MGETKNELKLEDIPGVGAATADKLREAGFLDVVAIAVAPPSLIAETAGLSEAVARKAINWTRENLDMGFANGKDLEERRNKIKKIPIGVEDFDNMMGGGFETGSITECYGAFGSSKTQIAHWLCVQVQQMEGEKKPVAVYIDTENSFRPERIKQFAKEKGMDPEDTLKNVFVARAFNTDHQMFLTEKIEGMVKEKNLNVKLIVIDSITSLFRAEYVGRGTLATRQQKLNGHLHTLSRIAEKLNACAYITNQVMTDPGQMFGDPTQSVGGNILAHASKYRVYLRRSTKNKRTAKLIDAPGLPDGACDYYICDGGPKSKEK